MLKIISKSVFLTAIVTLIGIYIRSNFQTTNLLNDLGGISIFASIFGTLFGILAAFIVVEVWGQYNKTAQLIDDEANGLEKLFRLTLFFRDSKFTKNVKTTLFNYMQNIVDDNFTLLSEGSRSAKNGKLFREISNKLNEVKFDDDHDNVIFSHIVSAYDELSTTRTNRISQSIARLPSILKIFLYVCIIIALNTVLFLPFQSLFLYLISIASISFVLIMVLSVIEDLDNPFVGAWNLNTEPYLRVMAHIESEYKSREA
jgi:membrane associated rhomboid family serine protease